MSLSTMVAPSRIGSPPSRAPRYRAPLEISSIGLSDLLERTGRGALADRQLNLLRRPDETDEVHVFFSGDLSLLQQRCVSIVGTREVSQEGWLRARKLSRELVSSGVVVISGLAKGVDTAAHTSAIENGGRTVAVIGTPLDKAYPAENSDLQERIYSDHLLLTPFRIGERTFKGNFPKRNRVMAAISDATVIIEASDTSGTLHQAAECVKLARWLFIMRSVAEDPRLAWPSKFIGKPKVAVLNSTDEIIAAVRR